MLGQGFEFRVSGEPPPSEPLRLLGSRICLRGLSKLLGIGSGRLAKLRKAARAGEDCPLDGRLREVRGPRARPQSQKRELIYDFLNELYTKHAEPIPDCFYDGVGAGEDKTLGFSTKRGKRPRSLKKRDKPLTEHSAKEVRQLPPGSYKDYLELFRSRHTEVVVTHKLFTRVPWFNNITRDPV